MRRSRAVQTVIDLFAGPGRGSCRAAVARHVVRAVARPVMRARAESAAIPDPAAVCGTRVLPTSLRHPKVGP